ncbi:hypothetical protein DY000_02007779 [Brassica cretica]|uniref:Uncharacterized protein n=1 Tax=Brassica cretica TaxID=69181 RepID=A0ABQ7CL13_BRACR|nr:hypothetical protein DY000_02007779 [Brassica cretica]
MRTRGSSGDPEVVEEPGGSPWILRSFWRPGSSPRPSGDRIRTLGYLDPEVAWEPGGSLGCNDPDAP